MPHLHEEKRKKGIVGRKDEKYSFNIKLNLACNFHKSRKEILSYIDIIS